MPRLLRFFNRGARAGKNRIDRRKRITKTVGTRIFVLPYPTPSVADNIAIRGI